MKFGTADYCIGVDEVGRGPIAGPLCVGACLTHRAQSAKFLRTLRGIRDSKKLTQKNRERWFAHLMEASKRGECSWSTVFVSERVIDRRGLSTALRMAISRVLRNLGVSPLRSRVLLDGGIRAPATFPFQETIIKGDEKIPLIASASIVAKVRRDRYMVRLARRFPEYGFDEHKGYGTKKHYRALKTHGISNAHRKSFLTGFVKRKRT